jgi:hypothetical protein
VVSKYLFLFKLIYIYERTVCYYVFMIEILYSLLQYGVMQNKLSLLLKKYQIYVNGLSKTCVIYRVTVVYWLLMISTRKIIISYQNIKHKTFKEDLSFLL